MTDLQLIKKRIYEEQRIEELLEKLECESITTEQRGSLYVAALPNGDNQRSVQVKNNENLGSSVRSRGISGDIYAIVSYIVYNVTTKDELDATLPRSKYWICSNLGYLEFIDEFYRETSDAKVENIPKRSSWLSKIQEDTEKEIPQNEVIDKKVLEKYGVIPNLGWLKEGISYHTQIEFGVGIDVQSERITFPVHNKFGGLVGVKGRYCGRNKEVEERYKYLYLEPCNKSFEFYNLHRALPYIKKKKEVIIVEGAKTVMLLWTWGYKNAISIEGDSMTDVQIELLKELGLFVRYVFAWDKDKSAEHISNEVRRLKGRLRYAMYDKEGYLDGKESPVDKGKNLWEKMLKENLYRIR